MNVEESLFRAARADSPRPGSRDRAVAAAALALEASHGSAGLLARLRYVILATIAIGAVTLVASRRAAPAAALEPTPLDAVPRSAVEIAPRVPPSVRAPEDEPRPVVATPAPPKPARAEDDLPHLLDAKRRLASGDAASALEALGHVRGTALAEEADALRIEALAASGDGEGARAAFRRFESAHPASPYAQRLRTLVR